jgi:hypothetical protein
MCSFEMVLPIVANVVMIALADSDEGDAVALGDKVLGDEVP